MNVTVQFYTEKLPVAYRMCMLSLIKDCIRQGDEQTYISFYSNNRPKPFAFSVFLHDFSIEDEEIRLTGFRLNLSSSDYQFLIPFLNGLQRTRYFQYKKYRITRGNIHYGRENRVQSSKIIVRTGSPILIEDAQGKPLSPDDPQYSEQFNIIAAKMSNTLRGIPLHHEIRIQPLQFQKTVIKEMNEVYEKAVSEGRSASKYLFFTAYRGRFVIDGHPSDLQWLLDTGVGLRTSQGFGHVLLESEVMI